MIAGFGVIIVVMGGYIMFREPAGSNNEPIVNQVAQNNANNNTPDAAPVQPKPTITPNVQTCDEKKQSFEKPVVKKPEAVEVSFSTNVYGATFVVRELSNEADATNSIASTQASLGSKTSLRKSSLPESTDGLQLLTLRKERTGEKSFL